MGRNTGLEKRPDMREKTINHMPNFDIPGWIERMLPQGHRRYGVDVGGQKFMHVMETGYGYPVLMLHGNPTWGFLYRRVIESLFNENLRCIAPDIIGLGFSSKPGRIEEHTLENHAGWVGVLIDQLDVDGLILAV